MRLVLAIILGVFLGIAVPAIAISSLPDIVNRGSSPALALSTGVVALSNCAANGSTTAALAAGVWRIVGGDELTYLCDTGASCASGGTPFAPSVPEYYYASAAETLYCRSAGALGDITLTKVETF